MPALSRPRPTIVLALLTLVVLATVPLALRAQAPTPDAPTVWGVDANALLKVDAAGATVLFEATGGGGHALAVDPVHQVVWTYQGAELRAYDFAGTWLRTITLTNANNTTPGPLAVNPEDGSVWVSYTHRSGTGETALEHRDAQGQLLVSRPEGADHLAVDASRGRVWAARATTLQALDAAGQVVLTLDLAAADPAGGPARGLAVDPATGRLWVVRDDTVVRYGAAGALDLVIPLPAHPVDPTPERWIARDGQGGVWAATPTALFRFDGAGTLLAQVNPWPGSADPAQPTLLTALAAEPATQAAWVATALFTRATAAWSTPVDLVQIGAAGQALQQRRLREAGGTDRVSALAFSGPEPRPEVVILAPADGSTVGTGTPTLELEYRSVGAGLDPTTLEVTADGQPWAVACTHAATGATCTPAAALTDGPHTLTVTVADVAGQPSTPAVATITVDTVPPVVTLTAPVDGALTNVATQAVRGEVSEAATLVVRHNGQTVETVPVASAGAFDASPVTLVEGANALEVVALDAAGHTGQASAQVTLDTAAPPALAASAVRVEILPDDQVRVTGAAGSVEPGTWVRVTNLRTGISVLVQAAADGSFTLTIGAEPGDRLEVTSTDAAQNTSAATEVVAAPPDPAIVAPALEATGVTSLADATAFLYTGPSPIQTGVTPGTITPQRAAVLRGRVLDRTGVPLPGAAISVLDHPEFGRTWSRADGAFDLAVNGGGALTVDYRHPDALPAQRTVEVPWQEFVVVEDVRLVPLDPAATVMTAGAPAVQVHQATPVTDADGTRRATVLLPAGTTAAMVLPDGTTQPLTTLTVRATEYTVGAGGPAAMPAELPPTSGYTYAAEFSVDEARAAGATRVTFSQPVVRYVENFLGLPVGTNVPVATYDRARAAWGPEPDGRVLRIVSITNGLADLDVNATAGADTPETLATLGITDAERAQLATLYGVGQSLWRVALPHFSPGDFNYPLALPADAVRPTAEPQVQALTEDPCTQRRSVVECENRVLGEDLPLVGTGWGLHYRSDRVGGRAAARRITVPVTGASVPSSLKRAAVRIEVAGQVAGQTYDAPGPGTTFVFDWNGRDAYGRALTGAQRARVAVSFVYPGRYAGPRCPRGAICLFSSFGLPPAADVVMSTNVTRMEVTVTVRWTVIVGSWLTPPEALGGWTLTGHHAYDPVARVLHRGDGSRQTAQEVNQIIETVAGTGTAGRSGDGGPARQAQLWNPEGLALAPDGTLYIAERGSHVVRKILPDGTIAHVAGTGVAGSAGLGGPAAQAQLNRPRELAVMPDGSLLIADRNNNRVVRVTPDGRLVRVLGGGATRADGALATQSATEQPWGLAAAPDGTWLVSEVSAASLEVINQQIRRVGPDGRIVTVAGIRHSVFECVQGGPTGDRFAAQVGLCSPVSLAWGPDGTLYVVEQGLHQVRAIGVDGRYRVVAGVGTPGYTGDGGPALAAQLRLPEAAAVGADGSLYIVDRNHTVRRLGPDGVITTLAGTGFGAGTAGRFRGDGGPASAADLNFPMGVAVAPDGTVYIADSNNHRIRRVRPPLPGLEVGDLLIPSADGTEVYRFTGAGRHEETRDALTGAVTTRFRYDAQHRLIEVEAVVVPGEPGLVTTIERDAAGRPTAIVAPTGERTTLTLDAQGYLASVTNPANETVDVTYHPGGLLATMRDPRQGLYAFSYDALGQLVTDADPAGGSLTLAETREPQRHTVTVTTAESSATSYTVDRRDRRWTTRTVTTPEVIQPSTARVERNGTTVLTAPDGTVTTVVERPEPRFGMQAALPALVTVRAPSGLTATLTTTRTATLSNPLDPLSLTAQTDIVGVNGRAYRTTWTAGTRTLTSTTPAGRTVTRALDALGRVVRVEAAGLAPVAFTYNARGRLATITEGAGSTARVTGLGYDVLDRLVSVTDPLGRITEWGYDLAGRVTRQALPRVPADPPAAEIGLAYDANGNVTAVTPPGRPAHAFTYTPVDLEASYDPPVLPEGPTPTTTAYNLDRQPTLVTQPGAQTIDLGYDTGGRLATVTQPRGTTTVSYDPATGRLTGLTAPDGGTLAFTYDGSLLTGVTWGNGPVTGSVSWTYDSDFRLATEAVTGAQSVSYTYDPDSLVTGAGALSLTRDLQTGFLTGTTLGAVTDSRTYTPFGELDTYAAQVSGAPVLAVAYVRDALGRIIEKTETIEGVTTVTGYRYDAVGRLDQVTVDGVVTATYTYDANGNRLSATTPGGAETGAYDAQDRLLTYGGATYSYTANGELRTKTDASGTTTYTYDLAGNLTRVDLPDGRVIEYLIDGQNRRIGKKLDGVLVQGWLYRDQLKPVAEIDGSGQVVARFVYGSNPLVPDYIVKGGATYRLLTDHLGSPRLVVDTATGVVVQRRDYDAWGNVLLDTNPGFQPFGFAGGLDDPDTRLVRFGVRDYDPEIGRWMAKDQIGFRSRDSNLYGYASGDPISYLDPDGRAVWHVSIGAAWFSGNPQNTPQPASGHQIAWGWAFDSKTWRLTPFTTTGEVTERDYAHGLNIGFGGVSVGWIDGCTEDFLGGARERVDIAGPFGVTMVETASGKPGLTFSFGGKGIAGGYGRAQYTTYTTENGAGRQVPGLTLPDGSPIAP